MKISTKGRYALRILADIAEHGGEKNVPIREIAERQGFSDKYLEGIICCRGLHCSRILLRRRCRTMSYV